MAQNQKVKIVNKCDPIAFEVDSTDRNTVYIFDASTGREPECVDEDDDNAPLIGSFRVHTMDDDVYATYGLSGEFSEENLKDILAVGTEYTKRFEKSTLRASECLPDPPWKKAKKPAKKAAKKAVKK